MKKILTVLLILAVAAGGLFAQEEGAPALKFTGDIKTGLVFHQSGDGNTDSLNDGTLGFWHDDAGPIRINLTGTYEAENHGAWFTLFFKPVYGNAPYQATTWPAADGTTGQYTFDASNVAIDSGGVWGEILNDMVKFTVGVTGSKWGTGGKLGNHLDKSSGDSNLAVEIKPIEGLNFGFTLGDRSWLKGAAAGYGTRSDGSSPAYTAGDMFKTIGGGISYKSASFDIYAGGRVSPLLLSEDPAAYDNRKAYLDVFIRPIGDPLEIEIGGIAYSLGEFGDSADDIQQARILGTLFGTYKTDANNAGSLTVFGGGDIAYHLKKDAALGWKATLGVGYQLSDPLKIGLEGNIQTSAETAKGGSNVNKGYNEDKGEGYVNKDGDTAFRFEVKPNVTYKLADNAEIVFSYKLNVLAFEKDNLEHTVQLNLVWTF